MDIIIECAGGEKVTLAWSRAMRSAALKACWEDLSPSSKGPTEKGDPSPQFFFPQYHREAMLAAFDEKEMVEVEVTAATLRLWVEVARIALELDIPEQCASLIPKIAQCMEQTAKERGLRGLRNLVGVSHPSPEPFTLAEILEHCVQ